MSDSPEKIQATLLDVRRIIGSKNPTLLKFFPRFLLNYIKKVVHQDDINDFIYRFRDKFGLEFLDGIIMDYKITPIVKHEENIPRTGRYIFVANHPLGGLESVVFMTAIGKHHEKVRFIVNDILMNVKNFSPLFLPINKHGFNPKEYARQIDDTFSSDAQILIFPAGLVSRKVDGKVMDLEWKKNFISKSIQYKRDVVPVFIDGRNTDFFYNLSTWRKRLGIKANIEMIYLPTELYKKVGSSIAINIGKPISYTTFDKRCSQNEWAEKVKKHVYSIGNNDLLPIFEG